MADLAIEIERLSDQAVPDAELAKALRERETIGNWLLRHTCATRLGVKVVRPTRYLF